MVDINLIRKYGAMDGLGRDKKKKKKKGFRGDGLVLSRWNTSRERSFITTMLKERVDESKAEDPSKKSEYQRTIKKK